MVSSVGKKMIAFLMVVAVIPGGTMSVENQDRLKILDEISGAHYQTIQKSLKVFETHKLDLLQFDVRLVNEASTDYLVLSETGEKKAHPRIFAAKTGSRITLGADDAAKFATKSSDRNELAKISGKNLRAIQAATGSFTSRTPHADLAQYKIQVIEDGKWLVVTFANKHREPGARGHIPGRPSAEVTVDPSDFAVEQFNFIR